MATNAENTARKHADLRRDYERMRKEKMPGGRIPKHTAGQVIAALAHRYYLTERTVEDIVYGRRK